MVTPWPGLAASIPPWRDIYYLMYPPPWRRVLPRENRQMKVKSIYCPCGHKLGDFTAEELAESWDIPANDEVWREYCYWRDYIEAKKSGDQNRSRGTNVPPATGD